MADGNDENPAGNLSAGKLAIASLVIGVVSLFTFSLMLVGALSGIALGLASLFRAKNNPARGMTKPMAVAGILLSIAAFLPPYFYAVGNANAACTERRLQRICAAEVRYHELRSMYGTLEELAGAGLIGDDLAAPVKCGYRVELHSDGGSYEVTASPETYLLTGRKTFHIKLPRDQ